MKKSKNNPEHIIFSYKFDGNGGGELLFGDKISKELKNKNLAWVHLDASHPDTKSWLEAEVDYLDDIIINALLAEETRPRLTEFNNGAVVILRGANFNAGSDPEDMLSIRMWIDESRIITMRRQPLKSAQAVAKRLEKGSGPKHAGDFLADLASNLFERMDPIFDSIEEKIDDAEKQVMEKPSPSLRSQIIEIRKETMIFKRYIAPQREIMNKIHNSTYTWMTQDSKRKIYESYNSIWRYMEELDTLRERAQIVKDELVNSLSDKLNRNLYVLSVISAIFLPLGFLTGLLGVNVGGIPGSDNAEAFLIFCLLLGALVIIQLIIFKIIKWF